MVHSKFKFYGRSLLIVFVLNLMVSVNTYYEPNRLHNFTNKLNENKNYVLATAIFFFQFAYQLRF
jgi:hypothetical protein